MIFISSSLNLKAYSPRLLHSRYNSVALKLLFLSFKISTTNDNYNASCLNGMLDGRDLCLVLNKLS